MTNWIKEIERDILALGSIIFYFLVIGRALVGPFWALFTQLIIAAVIFIIIFILTKKFDTYISRGFILALFTSLYYESIIYSVFASTILILIIISSYHLGNPLRKIMLGIFVGLLCSAAGFFGEKLFIK